jgi:hypothetical protein
MGWSRLGGLLSTLCTFLENKQSGKSCQLLPCIFAGPSKHHAFCMSLQAFHTGKKFLTCERLGEYRNVLETGMRHGRHHVSVTPKKLVQSTLING